MSTMSVDWDEMREMHGFCADRAFEKMARDGARRDLVSVRRGWRALRVVDVMYADAKRCVPIGPRVAHALREQVVQHHDHAEFRLEWITGPTRKL